MHLKSIIMNVDITVAREDCLFLRKPWSYEKASRLLKTYREIIRHVKRRCKEFFGIKFILTYGGAIALSPG